MKLSTFDAVASKETVKDLAQPAPVQVVEFQDADDLGNETAQSPTT